MKVVLQRAKNAEVIVDSEVKGKIDSGLVLLVGVTHDDTEKDADYLAEKIVNLRIFEDENEKMNLSLKDIAGSILSISQFTLYGDTKKEDGRISWKPLNLIMRLTCMNILTISLVI